MEKHRIFDKEFKQNVAEGCEKIKNKLSDTFLTEEGNLDTAKIETAARDTFNKVETGVKEGYQKFSDAYLKEDGSLNKEKLGDTLNTTYYKAGRVLASSITRLAERLTDKFGTDSEEGQIIDAELVAEDSTEEG